MVSLGFPTFSYGFRSGFRSLCGQGGFDLREMCPVLGARRFRNVALTSQKKQGEYFMYLNIIMIYIHIYDI